MRDAIFNDDTAVPVTLDLRLNGKHKKTDTLKYFKVPVSIKRARRDSNPRPTGS